MFGIAFSEPEALAFRELASDINNQKRWQETVFPSWCQTETEKGHSHNGKA